MSIIRNDQGNALYPAGWNHVAEDTSFVAGDSPASVDVRSALGRNAQRGYIICDGPGSILVNITHDGTNYLDQFTLKSGEVFDVGGFDVDTIKITHSGTDSAYRINVW